MVISDGGRLYIVRGGLLYGIYTFSMGYIKRPHLI